MSKHTLFCALLTAIPVSAIVLGVILSNAPLLILGVLWGLLCLWWTMPIPPQREYVDMQAAALAELREQRGERKL